MNLRTISTLITSLFTIGYTCTPLAAPIKVGNYYDLKGAQYIDFEDIPGSTVPGTSYDGTFETGNTLFGERFSGQILGAAGNFDSLSTVLNAPLSQDTLLAGSNSKNLAIRKLQSSSNVLAGLGNSGFPNDNAFGEGAISMLFDHDQSEFGLQILGGNAGTANILFYRRDGSLIAEQILSNLANGFYGFSREGSTQDIAGVSIFNNDSGGFAIDNIRYNIAGIHGYPQVVTVPEPGVLVLLGLGLLGLQLNRRRALQR